MNYSIWPGERSGMITIPSSKSMAHRLLIAAALSGKESTLICDGLSEDIKATIRCLCSTGVVIETENENRIHVASSRIRNEECVLDCGESGSTLRFMLPVVGALGLNAKIVMAEGLARRPMDALVEELTRHGMQIKKDRNSLEVTGQLEAGEYSIPGNISSQYITGLLFALPLLRGESTLRITGRTESADYIRMTENVLLDSGIKFGRIENGYVIPGGQTYSAFAEKTVEADWSNAAFFLCMGAMSEKGISIMGLNLHSLQGDREILNVLRRFGAEIGTSENKITVQKEKLCGTVIDASSIPDLVPTISALAACAEGTTRIVNAERLRYKESDRLETTRNMLFELGADVEITDDGLVITGKKALDGGVIDAAGDHRIAMAAAVASCMCTNVVEVVGAECVNKSYPDFWRDFETLFT